MGCGVKRQLHGWRAGFVITPARFKELAVLDRWIDHIAVLPVILAC